MRDGRAVLLKRCACRRCAERAFPVEYGALSACVWLAYAAHASTPKSLNLLATPYYRFSWYRYTRTWT